MPIDTLYPTPPLLRTHALPVGDGHVLQVQEFGAANGIAAALLHGGPGSGSSPLLRRFFDPARYRVICIDQRGAGASRPQGATDHNTTADLLADLRRVREHLDLARWLVVGGSWGATLAVAHAAAEPDAVDGLLLRASFLGRREDIVWFFQGAAAEQPRAWQRFAAAAPVGNHDALLPWFAATLASDEAVPCAAAALAWWQWEQTLATGASPGAQPGGEALAALVARYRIQSHYLLHDCWLAAPTLLERCEAVPRVPTLLLHGDNDRVCRPEGALALARHLPHARLRWIAGAGHDPSHPDMASAMVAALDHFAAQGDFAGPA